MHATEHWKRADLHLHTTFSGWRRLPIIRARDSYLSPEDAYAAARRRGMDFVCFTDHDTIDGALDFLSRHPGEAERVIIGEELELRLPDSAQWFHVGVHDIDESIHADLMRLRHNGLEALAYLRRRGVLVVLNHPFQSFRSIRAARRHLPELLALFTAVEACNSTSPRSHRGIVEAMASAVMPASWAPIGGSDAHTERRVAAAYTLAPGATKQEFLAHVARGTCAVGGGALGLPALIGDVYRIVGQYYAQLIPSILTARGGPAARGLLGALALLPPSILGLPAFLTTVHAARQEWIARFGPWARTAPEFRWTTSKP